MFRKILYFLLLGGVLASCTGTYPVVLNGNHGFSGKECCNDR